MSPLPPPAEGLRMSGPPVLPPEAPNLSAYPLGQEGGGQTAPPGPHQAGAIPKLVFGVIQQLDILARALPGGSEDLEQAKALIQGAMIKALRGGRGSTPAAQVGAAEPEY